MDFNCPCLFSSLYFLMKDTTAGFSHFYRTSSTRQAEILVWNTRGKVARWRKHPHFPNGALCMWGFLHACTLVQILQSLALTHRHACSHFVYSHFVSLVPRRGGGGERAGTHCMFAHALNRHGIPSLVPRPRAPPVRTRLRNSLKATISSTPILSTSRLVYCYC